MNLNIYCTVSTRKQKWLLAGSQNTEVRTFSSGVGSQLTFGSFILYLDRGKVERETKHGGHKREHSIGSGHDGIFFELPESWFLIYQQDRFLEHGAERL